MKRLFAILGLLSLALLGTGCASGQDFDARLDSIVEPYRFSLAEWEFSAISHDLVQLLSQSQKVDDGADKVNEYFSLIERIKNLELKIEERAAAEGPGSPASLHVELSGLKEHEAALQIEVETIIERQIKETLAQRGIYNPLDDSATSRVTFPPVSFKLENPPYLLVISPRDRIERLSEVMLKQSLNLDEIKEIEAKADELGVSSLVVGLGGVATYPSFVNNNAGLRFAITTATEEWLHQYLAFKPLGIRYLLDITGIRRDPDIATMNETLAGMVSGEIGSLMIENYYPALENTDGKPTGGFDFDKEMREIRKAVDEYLARGQVQQAEEFMEQKRQYLISKGYYIRKLNQAYFAFHGAYADKPAFINPIGIDLKELRSRSESLKAFLDEVARMTDRQDLTDALNSGPE